MDRGTTRTARPLNPARSADQADPQTGRASARSGARFQEPALRYK